MIWRKKYDRIQINRNHYRIDFNWNAYTAFMEAEGMNFGQIDQFDKLNHNQLISLIYEGIKEGSRLDNKIFPYSKEDFIAMLTPEAVQKLSYVFLSQNMKFCKSLKKE